jgi:hypothetical protein
MVVRWKLVVVATGYCAITLTSLDKLNFVDYTLYIVDLWCLMIEKLLAGNRLMGGVITATAVLSGFFYLVSLPYHHHHVSVESNVDDANKRGKPVNTKRYNNIDTYSHTQNLIADPKKEAIVENLP